MPMRSQNSLLFPIFSLTDTSDVRQEQRLEV